MHLVLLAEFGGKGERQENRPDSNYVLNTKSRGKGKRDQILNLKYFQNIKKQDPKPTMAGERSTVAPSPPGERAGVRGDTLCSMLSALCVILESR
jgi:hypothetical protein